MTAATEGFFLPVDLSDLWGEAHRTAVVVAVLEAERVADLVDDLLPDAIREDVGGGALAEPAVGGGPEAVRGDDAAPAVEIGEAEDVVALSVEEVDGGDGDVLLAAAGTACDLDERLRPVLPASRVVCVLRDVLLGGDGDLAVVDTAETRRRLALHRRGDVADWDDVDAHTNSYAASTHKHPAVEPTHADALADALADHDRLVEVGIGYETAVAAALAERGCTVVATDVHERETPDGVAFVRDDVTTPETGVYEDADAVYALNCPPELHRPLREIARTAGATCAFTTLGGDQPAVPVSRRMVGPETLYVARTR